MKKNTSNTISIDDLVLHRSLMDTKVNAYEENSEDFKKYHSMINRILDAAESVGIGLTRDELCNIVSCRQWDIGVEVNLFCRQAVFFKQEWARLLGLGEQDIPFLKKRGIKI